MIGEENTRLRRRFFLMRNPFDVDCKDILVRKNGFARYQRSNIYGLTRSLPAWIEMSPLPRLVLIECKHDIWGHPGALERWNTQDIPDGKHQTWALTIKL